MSESGRPGMDGMILDIALYLAVSSRSALLTAGIPRRTGAGRGVVTPPI